MLWSNASNPHPNAPPSRRSNKKRNSQPYRSKRSVRLSHALPSHVPSQWTRAKLLLLCVGTVILAIVTLSPILLLEQLNEDMQQQKASSNTGHVGLHSLLHTSERVKQQWHSFRQHHAALTDVLPSWHEYLNKPPVPEAEHEHLRGAAHHAADESSARENPPDEPQQQDLARGVSGLPLDQTPALLGARRGHIENCEVDVDELVYWNDPQGKRDLTFESAFADNGGDSGDAPLKFLTFEPDQGGWNNVRMSMENIFLLAAATGRTLVMPPQAPFYLLGMGKEGARSFGDFFPLDKIRERISIMTMKEFFQTQGTTLLGLTDAQVQELLPVADMCVYQANSDLHCDRINHVLREKGIIPEIEASKQCLVFDEDVYKSDNVKKVSLDDKFRVERFCGTRKQIYYTSELHDPPLLHFLTSDLEHRLLMHFYAFMYFTNPITDNYYKRFVRDFLHYKDEIFCAAGKIIKALGDSYSSLHVRRGEFQYKVVKIPAEEWYNNTKEIWKPKEVLYIATDERNKTWFDPIAKHHPVKFLDDYWDLAGLGKLDSSYLGMIDTLVASRGRAFAGTWFSTFTGYINRMRGYHGLSMQDSWYSFLDRKTTVQKWEYPHGNYHAREWHIGWVGIDGDQVIEHEASGEPEILMDVKESRKVPTIGFSDLVEDVGFSSRPVARGLAGRPLQDTPAAVGASRAHIECDVNVDSLAYWNDPQGQRDLDFVSPFVTKGDETKYISFLPDRGGWNNVRMSMEIIFVIAAASGRTLVLPPEQNLYLLHHDKGKRQRGFADFFPLQTAEFQKRLTIISFEEFIRREGGKDGRVPIPEDKRLAVTSAAQSCENRKKSEKSCEAVDEYLVSAGHVPSFRAQDYCVVFDKDVYEGKQISPAHNESYHGFCGNRTVAFWNSDIQDHVLIHIRANEKSHRLLTHFYNMLHFTDPAIDHYYKRFVRDFLHYHDSIYCAAGKIVKALQVESRQRGLPLDDEDGGGYSALHVRRGDLQYKRVKIPAEEWYENTKELWRPNEILYIATDERNKTFFDPIARHFSLRFLDDYWDFAGLGDLDPNYMGMVDTIVASRGDLMVGTWFSTFSGYINRMRGYHGMTMMNSWYSFLPKKTGVHEWKNISKFAYAYEWPDGWVGIDGDVRPSKDKF